MAFHEMKMVNAGQDSVYVKEVNFRETEDAFVYKGIRGLVTVTKTDFETGEVDRAGAYLHFLGLLDEAFSPRYKYHQFMNHRMEVPALDEESAPVFLSVVDDTVEKMGAFAA